MAADRDHGRYHYPEFEVMAQADHWDPHTRDIVERRQQVQSLQVCQYLNMREADTLFQLCGVLLDDWRIPVLAFVVHHFDATLQAGVGESQRKVGVPAGAVLIREGLRLLDRLCSDRYGVPFASAESDNRKQIVQALMDGNVQLAAGHGHGASFPAVDFMNKIVSDAVAAYYSHPAVWSEIGYAGPAYPRGYVRSELGLTDPWEATRDGK